MEEAAAILLEVAKYIADHHDDIGRWWSQVTHGVTNVKAFENRTGSMVRIWKVDKKGWGNPDTQQIDVPPGETINGDFWIPWADNPGQYADHHMEISLDGSTFAWVWQSGPSIRFAGTAGFVQAPVVPSSDNEGQVLGLGESGGERRLVIAMGAARPIFFFTGFVKV